MCDNCQTVSYLAFLNSFALIGIHKQTQCFQISCFDSAAYQRSKAIIRTWISDISSNENNVRLRLVWKVQQLSSDFPLPSIKAGLWKMQTQTETQKLWPFQDPILATCKHGNSHINNVLSALSCFSYHNGQKLKPAKWIHWPWFLIIYRGTELPNFFYFISLCW